MKINKKKKINIFILIVVIILIMIIWYSSSKNLHKLESTQMDDKILADISKAYTVTFDANGGTGGPQYVSTTGQFSISTLKPTREGYNFKGWSTDPNATSAEYQPGGTCQFDDDTTLYAVWDKIYTITFNANGGTGGPQYITTTVLTGTNSISTLKPTRQGYNFKGWSTDPNATSAEYQPGGTCQFDDDTTLYAVWDKIYTITFNANGGTGGPQYITTTVLTGANSISTLKPTREGYNFKGWSTDPSATSAEYQPGGTCQFDDDITLYAVWEKEKEVYTITYDANGGTNKPENQTKQEGTSITLSSVIPTRQGYKFLGWSTNKNATTATYAANATFSEDGNITLYAVWEKEKAVYTITYDTNGGTNKPENQTKQEGTSIKLSSVIPTRKGYKFLGWSTNKNATAATYAANATFSEDKNVTLYAVWKKEKSEINNTTDSDITNSVINNTITNTVTNTTSNVISNTIKNDVLENNIVEDNTIEDDNSNENTIDDNDIDGNRVISGKDNEVKNKVERNAVSANNPDNTKAKTALPKAGMNTLKSVIALVVIISLIFGFKYKSTKLS